MSKVSVFNPEWIDLVFEGRNKSYGAYQLRRDDNKTTSIALLSGIGLMALLAGAPAIINYFSPNVAVADNGLKSTEVIVEEIPLFKEPETPKPDPVIEEPAKATPAAAAPEASAPTTLFKPLAPTSDPVEAPPTITTVLTTNPGSATTPGTPGGVGTTPSVAGVPGGTGTDESSTTIETTVSVDVMPTYPGGMQKFYEEVGKKFRTPTVEDATTLRVYVSFVIEKDGTMTNVRVLKDPGHDMGKEAIRVLQSIKTKWIAGKKAGQSVRTAYNLPITINVN
ncbi:hypothetical protein Q765_04000 [Flavobacterium rivuli WB 3.3-2 = DSM 21788]|uniref:TonB C-terminal domain-containing protein n=1 Tax=Flavobacterium rivuli WB 3.3-2 = DSM 21788 TaxID=1121895 RepID=A0A0A2M7H2_9FLAO|nr:energy transducer TonB [Flavobacterium rivuli]KGO88209.1 hypothetical protein Q765_04000 [Flavobacterium rivuli WB 3.3-2 = DSM 21788]